MEIDRIMKLYESDQDGYIYTGKSLTYSFSTQAVERQLADDMIVQAGFTHHEAQVVIYDINTNEVITKLP